MTQTVQTHGFSPRDQPPSYFDSVREDSRRRWDQLESDPELAGPWRQLFRQVQSPRHVLSELLQNADDAGAKHVSVRVEDGVFCFEHDGTDFTRDEFASLCRFGFSNKRNLHTIGFRGIGFKSTFSLGANVDVITPTLAVRFNHERFTEPIWIDGVPKTDKTQISVSIVDDSRLRTLEKNFEEWAESPASLLFFRNVTDLEINGQLIRRESMGAGPAPNSEGVRLYGTETHDLLIIRSPEEPFPDAALEEIEQERYTEDLVLPPCRVELVLGLPDQQRLYVVLPTGVRPELPFSCNAPFVQDPARFSIKDPSTSFTNRWLLERIANLAAESLIDWVDNRQLSHKDRSGAYSLVPSLPEYDDTIASDVSAMIAEPFSERIAKEPILLTADDELAIPPECFAFPQELHAVWNPSVLARVFGKREFPIISPEVSTKHCRLLTAWGWLETVSPNDILRRLMAQGHVPTPSDWNSLARLWQFIDDQGASRLNLQKLKIVPVQGEQDLASASGVVRLVGKKTLGSAEDWGFLSDLVKVLDASWVRFLALPTSDGKSPDAAVRREHGGESHLHGSVRLLSTLDLDAATSTEKVLVSACDVLFGDDDVTIHAGVKLAHIVAALDADVPSNFRYVVRDDSLVQVGDGVLADNDGSIEALVPSEWADEHVLHEDYASEFTACSREHWFQWCSSAKSGLASFKPFVDSELEMQSRKELERYLQARGVAAPHTYHYRGGIFRISDFHFDRRLCSHWETLFESIDTTWCHILENLLKDPAQNWLASSEATVREVARNRHNTRAAQCDNFSAAWIRKLSSLPCLPDVYGKPKVPAELFMRTADTEPLMGVEPFVNPDYDNESTRPLLKLLGVRDTPSGPDKIIDRIRALAEAESPPIHEVAKWYEALDKIVTRCAPDELAELQAIFRRERLILSDTDEWTTSREVFRLSDQQTLPNAPLVHRSTVGLPLWSRLGVEERPTLDLVLAWLHELESGTKLDSQTLQRVRACTQTHPQEIWLQCNHWLSLEGTWTPVVDFGFRIDQGSVVRIGDLFPAIKQRTADLRGLSIEVAAKPAFNSLSDLGAAIDYRLTDKRTRRSPEGTKPWMKALGLGLARIVLADEEHIIRVHELGTRMALTQWHEIQSLRITPYIDDTPAGQPHSPAVLWYEETLYAQDRPMVELFKTVVDELSRPFNMPTIADAIKACAERDEQFVNGYLEHNFEIAAESQDGVVGDAIDSGELAEFEADQNDVSAGQPDVAKETDKSQDPIQGEEGVDDDIVGDEILDREGSDTLVSTLDGQVAEEKPSKDKPVTKRPTLIQRFAQNHGFLWDDNREVYRHSSGEILQKSQGFFHWERVSRNGTVGCRYWVSDQSLAKGVEIPTELWELIDQAPNTCGLLLANLDKPPRELKGAELKRMLERGEVQLFPAKYRLCETADAGNDKDDREQVAQHRSSRTSAPTTTSDLDEIVADVESVVPSPNSDSVDQEDRREQVAQHRPSRNSAPTTASDLDEIVADVDSVVPSTNSDSVDQEDRREQVAQHRPSRNSAPTTASDLDEIVADVDSVVPSTNSDSVDQVIFQFRTKGVAASGYPSPGSGAFVVMAESMASGEVAPAYLENYRNKRDELIRKGTLVPRGDNFVFSKNVAFSSASQAASVVAAEGWAGSEAWTTADGELLRDHGYF